jgi:hypothetical protein
VVASRDVVKPSAAAVLLKLSGKYEGGKRLHYELTLLFLLLPLIVSLSSFKSVVVSDT